MKKAKVLIQQIQVGVGYFHEAINDEDDLEFVNNICIPSVRRYAERHGYDYDLHTEVPECILKMPIQERFADYRNMRLGYIRYLLLEKYKDYDYIVYYDSDVLVTSYAPAMPLNPGVTTRQVDYYRYGEIDTKNRRILSNAGWYIFDKDSAKRMYEYAVKRIDEIIHEQPEWFHDEHELAHMMDENLDILHNDYGDVFNHDASLQYASAYVPKKFGYHFVGGMKEMRYGSITEDGWLSDDGSYTDKFATPDVKVISRVIENEQ